MGGAGRTKKELQNAFLNITTSNRQEQPKRSRDMAQVTLFCSTMREVNNNTMALLTLQAPARSTWLALVPQ